MHSWYPPPEVPHVDHPYDEFPEGLQVSTWYREIRDQSGPTVRQWDPIPGRRAVKPVVYLDYHSTDMWWKGFIGHAYTPVTIEQPTRVPLRPDHLVVAVPFIPGDLVSEFGYQAFLKFDTQIKQELEPLDFLSSLRQLKDLIPKLTGSLTRDLASGLLTYEFGWKNFTQDVGHLYNIVSETEAKLQALRDSWGKEQHLVQKKVFDWVQPGDYDQMYYEPHPGYGFRYTLIKYKATLTVGTYRFHQLKDLDSALSFLRAAGVALGFGNPIKAVWDAIPGSFLINWFTSIGSFLESAGLRHLFSGPWELRHPCVSQKVKAKVHVTQENLNPGYYLMPNQVQDSGDVFVTRYKRDFGFPASIIRNKILELSPKQLLLLGALGTSKGSASW